MKPIHYLMMYVQSATATANYYQQSAGTSAVSVAAAFSALKINPRAKFEIQDSAVNIEKNLDALRKIANNVTSVTLTDTATSVIHLTAKQYLGQGSALLFSKMSLGGSQPVSLSVTDALARDFASISGSAKVSEVSVTDSAANIVQKLSVLDAGVSKLGEMRLTNSDTPLKITYDQYVSYAKSTGSNVPVLGHLVGTFGYDVTAAQTEEALGLAQDTHVNSVSIVDHAQAIVDHLDELQAMGLKVASLVSDDTKVFKVSASQLVKDAAVIGKIYKGYQLAVFNVDATSALSLKSNKKVISLDITDTAQNIAENLSLLNRLGNQLHSVRLTDGTTPPTPLALSASDFLRYGQVLDKIVAPDDANPSNTPVTDASDPLYNNKYQLQIFDASAVDAQSLKDNAHVTSIAVADTSGAIARNLDDLNGNSLVTQISQVGTISALNITAAQLSANTQALALMTEGYTLNLRGVSAADAQTIFSNPNNHVASLSVSGTGSEIKQNMDALAALGKSLTTIVQTDTAQNLDLSASDWMSHLGVLSKIVGGYGVNLSNVSASKALSMAADLRVRSFEISDTGAEIANHLEALQGLGAKLTAINQSDNAAIQITGKQYDTLASTLGKLQETYTLSVVNARASQIQSLAANTAHVSSIQVADTVANIAANLTALQTAATSTESPHPSISVAMTGVPSAFTLSKSQFEGFAEALGTIQGNYTVNITDVTSVADAVDLAANSHVVGMVLKEDSTDLSNPQTLSQLRQLGNKLTSIKQTDPGVLLSLSVSDWAQNMGVLNKIKGHQVALSQVNAASADNYLKKYPNVKAVSVADSAAQISSNFDKLMALGGALQGITTTGVENLQLSMAQWKIASSTLAKVSGNVLVDVTGATAQEAQTLVGNAQVASISITDTASGISANFDGLKNNLLITKMNVAGPSAPIALTMAQLNADAQANQVLSKIQGAYSLAVTQASVTDLPAIKNNNRVVSAELQGTASEIQAALPDMMLAGPRLKSLTLSDTTANPAINLEYSNFQKLKSVLGLIKQPFSVNLTNVNASAAVAEAQSARFNVTMSVRDSAAQIATNLDALANLNTKLVSITTTEALPVLKIQAKQYVAGLSTLGKINATSNAPQYQLAVTNADVSFARKMLTDANTEPYVSSLDVIDNANNVAANLDLMGHSKVGTITLSPVSSVLNITGPQYSQNSGSIAKIKTAVSLNVTEASPLIASTLQADAQVSAFSISALASQVGSTLPTLLGMSRLDHIDITGDTTMTMTAEELNLVQDDLVKVRGQYGLKITSVAMADLDAIASRQDVTELQIADTAQAIASGWDRLSGMAMGDQLKGISVTDSPQLIAITYDQWNQSARALSQLPQGQKLAILDVLADQATVVANESQVGTVSVKGTADQISAKFDDLIALGDKLDDMELTDDLALQLTQDQMDRGAATLAKVNGGYEVEILA